MKKTIEIFLYIIRHCFFNEIMSCCYCLLLISEWHTTQTIMNLRFWRLIRIYVIYVKFMFSSCHLSNRHRENLNLKASQTKLKLYNIYRTVCAIEFIIMDYNSVININKICRICLESKFLEENALTSLFNTDFAMIPAEMLMLCAKVKVIGDFFPKIHHFHSYSIIIVTIILWNIYEFTLIYPENRSEGRMAYQK